MNIEHPQVEIKIKDGGTMLLELLPEKAPLTVDNFLKLVKQGFYDGLIFHRIIEGFMIQGGDPSGNGTGGAEENIKGEFSENGVPNDLSHERGVISMARAMNPNSASSQFFICHKNAAFLDGKYAAFGKLLEGFEELDRLAKLPTNANDFPDEAPVMETVKVIKE
ncbi:MAG: peptidylprolyl isomerase [Eubacteriales bacterium]|nr:peptidylprolyl isomerase [Eubacteriales bacterium]